MTRPAEHLRAVEDGDLPVYPVATSERLDSHYFVQWNLRRWNASDFRRRAYDDPEVGFYGLDLFFLAHQQAPVGTLPCDPAALAFLLRMPLGRWQQLVSRELTPLDGWFQVVTDLSEVRLAHPVVTEVVIEALASKRRNAQSNADARLRKRLGQIAKVLREQIEGAKHIAKSDQQVNAISDWLEQAYPGGSVTQKRVYEALMVLGGNW